MKRAFLTLLTGATFALVAASPLAHATSMVSLSTDQLVDASDTIVRGTVTEVWTELDERGQVWTRAQVEVDEVLKGDRSNRAIIVDQMGGSWAGRVSHVPGVARFSAGEEAVMFLEELQNGRTVTVGMFQGKYTVRMDPYARQPIVQRWTASPKQDYDHRFMPLPAEDKRVSLNSFEEVIQDRLEMGWDGVPIPGTSTERLERINTVEVK